MNDGGHLDHLLSTWPVERAGAAIVAGDTEQVRVGETSWSTRTASVSKLLAGYAGLIALEEESLDLAAPAGPAGSTVAHLMAHASGLAFDDDRVLAAPGSRRIYSNTGIEVLAAYVENATGFSFADYLHIGVFEPLAMTDTELRGSPAHAVHSTVDDLARFAAELLRPRLIHPQTLADATRPWFPELKGVVPAVGSFDPNPWGLTFEIRGDKHPHWTGHANSPRTYGHFGGSGTFLWVDPAVDLACVVLTDRQFGGWALEAWPEFSDAVVAAFT